MQAFSKVVWSSVGKKFVMALTGLAMGIFLLEHVSGNLLLYSNNPTPYNKYAHFLISLGWPTIAAELVLVAFLLFHVFSGISIAIGKRKARPVDYHKSGDAGGPSKKTFASRSMIFTGLLTLVFIVIHLKTFKFGPTEPPYTTRVGEVEMRNLYRLVWDVFKNPFYVAWYVGSIGLLGFHLRHGFWSAFQSLGISHPRYSPLITSVGILLAIAIAASFIGIPIWVYFTGA
ncbi:MAG: succinate dehydrogenase cytochrome b subunit [bacterium]